MVRVLLVDDHDMVRMALKVYLETCEHIDVVGEANGGQKALELVRRLQPNLVLLDLIMPVMNGVETAQAIREQYPMIKILMLTSTVEVDLIDAALKAGADGYVPKAGGAAIIKAIDTLFPD